MPKRIELMDLQAVYEKQKRILMGTRRKEKPKSNKKKVPFCGECGSSELVYDLKTLWCSKCGVEHDGKSYSLVEVPPEPESLGKIEQEVCPTGCPNYPPDEHGCTVANCIEIEKKLKRMGKLGQKSYEIASGNEKVIAREKRKKKCVPREDAVRLKYGLRVRAKYMPNEGIQDEPLWDEVVGDKQLWTFVSCRVGGAGERTLIAEEPTHLATIRGVRDKQVYNGRGFESGGCISRVLAKVEVATKNPDAKHRFSHSSLFCERCGYRRSVSAGYANEVAQKCPECKAILTFYRCSGCLTVLEAVRIAYNWYVKKRLPSLGSGIVYLPYKIKVKVTKIRERHGRLWID